MMDDKKGIFTPDSIFLNDGVFGAQLDTSWLKPYILIFENIILEDRYSWSALSGQFAWREPKAFRWLEDNAVFLEDYDFAKRRQRTKNAIDRLRPQVVTKANRYNKNFLKSFAARMARRGGGPSDRTSSVQFKKHHGAWSEFDSRTDGIIIDELVDAEASIVLSATFGVPSVLDELQQWLYCRAYQQTAPSASQEQLTRDLQLVVPRIRELDWDLVFQLRESKYRRAALKKLQTIASSGNKDISDELLDSMWRLVTEAKCEANVGKAIIKGVVSNIPIKPVNPLSLSLAGADAWKARRKRRKYSWLFFLEEVNSAAIS